MRFLALTLSVFLWLAPALAQEQRPYLAIYTSADRVHRYSKDRFNHPIDLIVSAKNWDSFVPFLQKIKKEAQGRKIIIDLCAHGTDTVPVLLVGTEKHSYVATFGGVVNKIEENLEGLPLVLVAETCFSPTVYSRSINPYPEIIDPKKKKCLLEDRKAGNPNFPIYGITKSYSNPIPTCLESYLHSDMSMLVDLRQFRGQTVAPLDSATQDLYRDIAYAMLWFFKAKDHINKL
jgi:hypothetical protein